MKKLLSKIFHYIGIVLDWIGKNAGRIKTCGLIVLLTLFIISFINGGCNRREAEKLFTRVTGLDLQNDILDLKNRTLEDSLNIEVKARLAVEAENKRLEAERVRLVIENQGLKKKLADIPAWLLNMPADSSYKFLHDTAYPFPGADKFPFNEPQVKNIHADYLENQALTSLVVTLEDQLVNCEQIGYNKDTLVLSYRKSFLITKESARNSDTKASNSEEKASLYKDQLDKNERRKRFWKATTAIGTAIGLVIGLLL